MIISKFCIKVMMFSALAGTVCSAEEKVRIGSGNTVGIYYSASSAVAKMFNPHRAEYGQYMITAASEGTMENILNVQQGEVNFGLAQANLLEKAYEGGGPWSGKPQKNLRAVLRLHMEDITIVAAEDAGVYTMADLKGKRVSIGARGSSDALYGRKMLIMAGLNTNKLTIVEQHVSKAQDLMNAGEIDAYVFTVGHPAFAVRDASSNKRKIRLVPLDPALVKEVVESGSLLKATEIPVDYYPELENREPVPSLGVRAMLFTTEDESDETVYRLVKNVMENLDLFHLQHPVLRDLEAKSMAEESFLPLHPGAKRYFKEAGLLK